MFNYQPQFKGEIINNPYRRVEGRHESDEIIRLFHIKAPFHYYIASVAILVLLLIVEMAWEPCKICLENILRSYYKLEFKKGYCAIYLVYIILAMIFHFMGTLVETPFKTGKFISHTSKSNLIYLSKQLTKGVDFRP